MYYTCIFLKNNHKLGYQGSLTYICMCVYLYVYVCVYICIDKWDPNMGQVLLHLNITWRDQLIIIFQKMINKKGRELPLNNYCYISYYYC